MLPDALQKLLLARGSDAEQYDHAISEYERGSATPGIQRVELQKVLKPAHVDPRTNKQCPNFARGHLSGQNKGEHLARSSYGGPRNGGSGTIWISLVHDQRQKGLALINSS
jgi:hypothetical protein